MTLLSSRESVPSNLLYLLSYTIKQLTPAIREFDYNPLINNKKTKKIIGIIKRLLSSQLNNWDSLANECIYLEIAICTDKIDEHEKGV